MFFTRIDQRTSEYGGLSAECVTLGVRTIIKMMNQIENPAETLWNSGTNDLNQLPKKSKFKRKFTWIKVRAEMINHADGSLELTDAEALDLMVSIVAGRTARHGFPYEYVETWPREVIEWAFTVIMGGKNE